MGLHAGQTPSFSAFFAARAISGYDGPVGQCYKYRKLFVNARTTLLAHIWTGLGWS